MNISDRPDRTFETRIEKLVYGGSGLCRHRGKVVFVPFSAPGDRLLVQKVREKKDYASGEIAGILQPAPERTDPPCPHFGKCGGCHWQHLDYACQVEAKRNILRETFHHRFPNARAIPISMKACPQPFGYRSRARIQLRKSGPVISTGFFRSGSRRLESIEKCLLLRSPLNQAFTALKNAGKGSGIRSDVREFDIAGSSEEGLWTATPVTHNDDCYRIPDSEINRETLLKRQIDPFQYSVTASVFFQANDFMVPELVRLVREMAENTGGGAALDLFAGVGLFSLPLADIFKKVVSIENSPAASQLCSVNASAAGTDRIRTVCADVAEWLESEESGIPTSFDLILLDPPRKGAGSEVMSKILSLAPRVILYVSCDPQTLSRDLSFIPGGDYKIDRIEGLDMFPQTYHFETIVRLARQ